MKGGEAEMKVGWTRAEAPSDATEGRPRWSPGKGRLPLRKSPGGARRARKTLTKRRRRSGRSLRPPAAPAHLQVAQVLSRAVRLPAALNLQTAKRRRKTDVVRKGRKRKA